MRSGGIQGGGKDDPSVDHTCSTQIRIPVVGRWTFGVPIPNHSLHVRSHAHNADPEIWKGFFRLAREAKRLTRGRHSVRYGEREHHSGTRTF